MPPIIRREAIRRRFGEVLNWTALTVAAVLVSAAILSFVTGYGEAAQDQAALLAVAALSVALGGRAMLYVLSAPEAAAGPGTRSRHGHGRGRRRR